MIVKAVVAGVCLFVWWSRTAGCYVNKYSVWLLCAISSLAIRCRLEEEMMGKGYIFTMGSRI